MPRKKDCLDALGMVLVLLTMLVTACENDLVEVQKVISREQVRFEIAKDVEIFYSDSAIVRVKVTGPSMKRFLDRKEPYEEFPDGIHVDFYGENKRPNSYLSAKKATRYEGRNVIIVQDSVVWQSKNNERLETHELIWDDKEERVYTQKFVTIIKPDEIIYGHGFEANQDFSRWKINAIEGVIKVDAIDLENE